MKKKRKGEKYTDKIIIFPGTIDRYIEEAVKHIENSHFDRAVQSLEEAQGFGELNEEALRIYAYALFEIRHLEKAKRICEQLLQSGTSYYFEMIELYVTILIELRHFSDARQTIEALLEEQLVPLDKRDRFVQLLQLSEKLATKRNDRYATDVVIEDTEIDMNLIDFFQQAIPSQIQQLSELEELSLQAIENQMVRLIDHPSATPLIQTYAIRLLVQKNSHAQITPHKFEMKKQFLVNTLSIEETPHYVMEVLKYLEERFHHEPDKYQLVSELIHRHAFILYPFSWKDYALEDVAETYQQYANGLFGQANENESKELQFIKRLEDAFLDTL